VLSLSEVEEWHDRGLLVLRGVSGQNLLDELLVGLVELERDIGVILGRIAMLSRLSISHLPGVLVAVPLRD
jgi:hypothetical protein